MKKIDKLIKSLDAFISKASNNDDLEDLPEFPGLEKIPKLVDDYEKEVARLLREQRQWFLDAFNTFISKDDAITLESFLLYLRMDLFAADDFVEEFGEETAKFLQLTVEELANLMMESIDPDILLDTISGPTMDWIRNWSEDLGDIMKLTTHRALENELLEVIANGESIAQAEMRIKDLNQFNRTRARATARTEILTASSRAHYESFIQSPSVTGKKWKHSGAKKNNPRETHMAMDGVVIPVDDYFIIDGEQGLFPRDTSFSARNRVNCGCALGPDVDEDVLRYTKEEKEAIRQEVLADLSS